MTSLKQYGSGLNLARFQIETSAGVVSATKLAASKRRSSLRLLTLVGIGFYCLLPIVQYLRPAARSSTFPLAPTSILLILALNRLILWQLGRASPSGRALSADAQRLVIEPDSSSINDVSKNFAREEIRDVRFGAVHVGRYGSVMGILFEVHGTTKKAVPELEAPEANILLNHLSHLGFHVQRDPGMAMLVEMESTKRKSRFSRWLDV